MIEIYCSGIRPALFFYKVSALRLCRSSPPPATTTGETAMFLLFSLRGRPRTAHIYIPPKSPFDKGGLVARPCLALLRNSIYSTHLITRL